MLVNYKSRGSLLDPAKLGEGVFRGFYVLAWILLAMKFLDAIGASYQRTGHFFNLAFAELMTRDLAMLGISDAVLVGQTFLCVPIIRFASRNNLRPHQGMFVIQVIWYVSILVAVCVWIQIRYVYVLLTCSDWPWTQSGFFLLHAMVQLMKIHSYLTVNTHMANHHNRMLRKEQELRKVLLEKAPKDKELTIEGVWAQALRESVVHMPSSYGANAHMSTGFNEWANLELQSGASMVRAHWWGPQLQNKIPRSVTPVNKFARLVTAVERADDNERLNVNKLPEMKLEIRDPHPLMWHPDEEIKKLAEKIAGLREYLYADPIPGQELGPMWPYNVSFYNFWDFQLVPCLVYKLQYPRTPKVRWGYLAERIVALIGTFLVLYEITVEAIMPAVAEPDVPIVLVFFKLMAPMMICVRETPDAVLASILPYV